MGDEVERMSPNSGKAYDSESNVVNLVSQHGVLASNCEFEAFSNGMSYVGTNVFDDLALNEEGIIHFKTGANIACPVYAFLPTGDTEYSVYINPTLTGDGTEILTSRRNFVDVVDATAEVFEAPTITDRGTLATRRKVVGGSPVAGRTSGGDNRMLKLPPNTSVLYVFKSLDSGTDTISFEIDWRETSN